MTRSGRAVHDADRDLHESLAVETSTKLPIRLHDVIVPWVRKTPQALALRDAGLSLSYTQLDEVSRDAAHRLAAMGVRAGDRVLVVGENCVALGVLVLAIGRLDAWAVVANARLSEREIDLFVSHAEPRRVIYTAHVSSDAAGHARRHGAVPVSWTGLGVLMVGAENDTTLPEPCFDDPCEQVAALIYTSGTSGAPKGVMLTHANILFTATNAYTLRRIGPGDVIYCLLPMAHIVGLATQFYASVASGATLLLEPRFSPAEAARVLAEEGVTVFVGVPAVYARLLEWSRETGAALGAPTLRVASVAGSPLTSTLKAEVEARLETALQNGYGLTECGPTVAQTRTESPRTDCAVGPPIAGVEVRVVDLNQHDAAVDGVGELWVRSPGLMKGYYRNPSATAEAIDADGWFNTGDLVRIESDGALTIVGRTKELIIRSGLNVYPVEVEQAINGHPEVVQSAVVGRSVDDNEEVVAFVERVAGATLDAIELERYLRERLAPYKVPGDIRFMEALPAAPTGKVLKGVLRHIAATATSPTDARSAS